MYDDKYHFITFTLFSGLLSGFVFEMVIPEPDPIRISDLIFRSEPDPFVNDWIGFLSFRVQFTSREGGGHGGRAVGRWMR